MHTQSKSFVCQNCCIEDDAGRTLWRVCNRAIIQAETDISDIEPSIADGAESWLKLQNRVSEFTLPNGLHFIVLERHNAPVLSCHTYANVGAFDEEDGRTGGHAVNNVAVSASAMITTL